MSPPRQPNLSATAVMVSIVALAAACTNRDVEGQGQGDDGSGGSGEAGDTVDQDTNTGGGAGADDAGGEPDTGTTGGIDPADSTGDGGESSGTTGTSADNCRAVRSPGPLCGPRRTPCTIVVDEAITEEGSDELHTAPVITIGDDCQPQVHFTTSGGLGAAPDGSFSRRAGDGTWDTESAPFARGSALHYDAAAGHTMAIGGVDDLGSWVWDGRWSPQASVAPSDNVWTRATAAGVDGQMYLATGTSLAEEPLRLHTWDPQNPDVFVSAVVHDGSQHAFDVGGGPSPSVAWWVRDPDAWRLQIASGDTLAELDAFEPSLSTPGDPYLPGDTTVVAAGGSHVLYTTFYAIQDQLQQTRIRYAERDAAGDWVTSAVLASNPPFVSCAPHLQAFQGGVCDYDYTEVRALGSVADATGEVRLLFAEDHFVGQAVAGDHCPGPGASPVPIPTWWCPEGSRSSRLFVGWSDGAGGLQSQPIDIDYDVEALDATVDPSGAINLALRVDNDDAESGSSIRYVRLQ